jgi:hypothetical protein
MAYDLGVAVTVRVVQCVCCIWERRPNAALEAGVNFTAVLLC